MFKFLLATRYLRTRYIALASIVSVMLGVATMIVVNSVMSGFRDEMYDRLHGILSDVVVASHGLDGIGDSVATVRQIREVLGADVEGLTTTVHVPAVLSYRIFDEWETRQVNLIGIDDATYASVSDFSKFLLHPANKTQLSFDLREDGYDERLEEAGWEYRRWRVRYQRQLDELRHRDSELSQQASNRNLLQHQPSSASPRLFGEQNTLADSGAGASRQMQKSGIAQASHEVTLPPDPASCPHCGELLTEDALSEEDAFGAGEFADMVDPTLEDVDSQVPAFDEMRRQYPGIVLGIAISNVKHRNEAGEVDDYFLCRPGDDVQLTFPSAGAPPTAVNSTFTVVDFYESKMSEYDSTFAFCPLTKLQELRGMIDRESGTAAVTSIQIKLREGADLAAARDKLRARFPVATYRYRIETWKDMQGPLLAAVQWETTILNILLFLIIGVAGFGIFATFFMIVVEKTKDIGILKSLGAPSRGVMSIFISYGFALGTVGSGVGMVLGVLFVWNINQIARWIELLTGQEVFDPTVYYFQEIPTILNPITIAWIVVGAMTIAVLASIMPALRAARMHPVEALRYE